MIENIFSTTKGVQKIDRNGGYPGKPITETITNGFFTVDHQWTVKYWNKAAETLLMVPAKDIVGMNLWEKFAGILPVNFYEVYYKAFQQDIPLHFEEYWGEMGAWFDVITYHCDNTLSVSFKSSNHAAYSRQPAQPGQPLKTLNELYRFVTAVMNDCLWEWDLQTRELFWIDGGHKKVFGYPIENALIPQRFWESCLHPEDKARILAKLNKLIAEGSESLWEDEYRFKKANGCYAHVHDRGYIIYDREKGTSRMIGATQDITSRKVAEIQLLESERKLSLIARQTVNAVIIADTRGKITWVNSAFTRITEYELKEVIGRKAGSFLQGKGTDPSTVRYLRHRIKSRQPFDCQILNHSKSGRKYWIHVQGQPLLDENGKFERYFAMGTDITEKVLLENKLMKERLARRKEITAAVLTAQEKERESIGKELHDNLNQILGAAKLYIELAKADEENREMCLDKSTGYIVSVIEQIRRISKTLATPGIHIMGLFESIKILVDDLLVIHPIKISFYDHGIDEEELTEKMQLDIFRIVQEQMNNILKHANATRATIHLVKQQNEILLSISDNGAGTDILKEKSGVGLINIRSRAELYHGKVAIASKPGEGYELKVVLPLEQIPTPS